MEIFWSDYSRFNLFDANVSILPEEKNVQKLVQISEMNTKTKTLSLLI